MNCDAVHRCLLALDHLDEVPGDVRKHLDACPACRAMHEQLVQIETDIPQLPVPAPMRKAAFLEELARPTPTETRSSFFRLTSLLRPTSDGKRERALRKVAISVALAATLLISVIGIWLWNQDSADPNGKRDVLARVNKSRLQSEQERDARWRNAKSAGERVRLLDEWAIETEGKARALARGDAPDKLLAEVRYYKDVIDALTQQEAPLMTAEEKGHVLPPIANRLAEIESQARRLAMDHPQVASVLDELAMIASEGDRRLRSLL